jgi:hypothetical protein
MSKKHHNEKNVHSEHSEHKPKEKKVLGFEVKTIALLLVLVIGASIVSVFAGLSISQNSVSQQNGAENTGVDEAVLISTVEAYVNENLLNDESVLAKITDANNTGNGLYELSFEIYQSDQLVSAGVLYSVNGKLIIGNVFDLNTPLPKPEVPVEAEPVKSDKPVVELYLMSFCPYGNMAEDTMKPVYDLLKDKIEFKVNYIVSVSGDNVQSLHGVPEVTQNQRESCVLKNYDMDKWFEFTTYVNTNCGSDGACWETGAKALGIDTTKISECVSSEGLDLMKASEEASNLAGATGSPTMMINGAKSSAVYQYENSEAYKQAICNSFNTVPEECSVSLGSVTTTTGGSC